MLVKTNSSKGKRRREKSKFHYRTCSYMYGLVMQFIIKCNSPSPMLNAFMFTRLHQRRSASSMCLRTNSTGSRSFEFNKFMLSPCFTQNKCINSEKIHLNTSSSAAFMELGLRLPIQTSGHFIT